MMLLADGTTMLPGWLVLPVAALTLLVVAAHVLAVQAGDMPLRRKRLRIANGLLMMFVTALLAYALGMAGVIQEPIAQPGEARRFVLVWMAIIGLVGIVVALAGADAIATISHGWGVRKHLRQEMREKLGEDLVRRRMAQAAAKGAGGGGEAGKQAGRSRER